MVPEPRKACPASVRSDTRGVVCLCYKHTVFDDVLILGLRLCLFFDNLHMIVRCKPVFVIEKWIQTQRKCGIMSCLEQ